MTVRSNLSTGEPLGALHALRIAGYVVSIGQIEPRTRRLLDRLESQGKVVRGWYLGFPIRKKCWIATRPISYVELRGGRRAA